MTTRRTFIKTMSAIPAALTFGSGWAGSDPSRLALVIGNSAYRDEPLLNPSNDAKAVADLFTRAGFGVDSRINTPRTDMMEAIERFGSAVKRPETRLVVFYYAGHGVQLDWRNYLLPVDAVVERQEHIRQRCIDLNLLLGQLTTGKDKTFIVILDACRNNPFGKAYLPEQKGLSQFDAPVGSLLAYATSPGNVASDGAGENGLYTENLIRELARPNTRLEDAMKRVRLNVRLASKGAQIPWETTSLENDVFIFRDGQKQLSEAELEKLVEADIAEWGRIKSSRKIDDWAGYLRNFPNGRFAEIAQMRLAGLLAEVEKAKPAPSIPLPAGGGAERTAQGPMIEIKAGAPVPVFIAPSDNPFSAGRYPLGRIFTVGDQASYRQSDLLTGVVERDYTLRVTRVDREAGRVELNGGMAITDLMGNNLKAGPSIFSAPRQFVPAEFYVGKKWTALFSVTNSGRHSEISLDIQITRREKINVPAGSFDTFRIEAKGWRRIDGEYREIWIWLVPTLNFEVRREVKSRSSSGRLLRTERHELVSLRQQVFDTTCATETAGGARNLAVRSNCA